MEKVILKSLKACSSVSRSRKNYVLDMSGQWIDRFDGDDEAFDAEVRKWDRNRNVFLRECTVPAELHLFAFHWNWDNGIKSLRKLIKNPYCDSGTAMMVYWFSNPHYYCEFRKLTDCPEYNRDALALSRYIEWKFSREGFWSQLVPFDPKPWLTDEYDQYAVRRIPEIMFQPIELLNPRQARKKS